MRGRGAYSQKGKKLKTNKYTSLPHWFHEQMGKIVEMNKRTIAMRKDNSSCSIKDVMAFVKECGVLYLFIHLFNFHKT